MCQKAFLNDTEIESLRGNYALNYHHQQHHWIPSWMAMTDTIKKKKPSDYECDEAEDDDDDDDDPTSQKK